MAQVGLRYVLAPVIPEEIIYREKLCLELDKNKKKPLTVINTSAGFGKTVLLSEYSSRFLKNVCWLNSPFNISSAAELTLYLIYSIKQLYNGFGAQLIDYISSLETAAGPENCIEIVNLLLNEFIKTLREDVIIIIDDFQNLEQNNTEWINIYFNEMFASLPQNLKFIISTRQKPCFKVSRLEAKRSFFSLTTKDLEFNENEIKTLLKNIYRIECTPITVSELKTRTNGWITALHLIIQSANLEDLTLLKFDNSLYDYFTEDIFNLLEPEIKKFILSTSFLETMTASFCNELLNINNSEEVISKIISKNIFLDSFTKDNITYYCYQKLFSEFMEKFRVTHKNEQEIEKGYLKAAELFDKAGEIESAIVFYLKGNNVAETVKLINSNFNDKLKTSDYKSLNCWFGLLDKDLICSDTILLFNYLKYCLAVNKIETTTFAQIESLQNVPNTNYSYQTQYLLLKAEFYLITGKPDDSLEILEKLTNNNPPLEFLPEVYTLLTKAYYRKGFDSYDNVITSGERALEAIDINGSAKQKIEVINILGNLYFDKGENRTAIKYYELAISSEQNIKLTLKLYSVLITLYSDIGDWDNSKLYIDKFKFNLDKISTPLFERLLLRSEAQMFFNLGDFNFSLSILDRINQNKLVQSNQLLLLSNLWLIVQVYYYQNNKNLGFQTYELSKKYLDNNDEYFVELNKLFQCYYTQANITDIRTEQALIEVIEYHSKKNIHRVLPQLNFYLANHYFLAGNPETSLGYLKEAMDVFTGKNELVWCSNELHITRHMFDFAIANDLHKPFIKNVFSFTIDKLSYDWLSPEFRLELEGKIEKLTDIKFMPFGNTEFYQRGEAVAEDKWIRKKSKILLAYLMSDPEKIHTKDKIMDMFFDDMPADKADVVYHSAVYNIRTALKIYDIKSDKPKRSKDKTYDYNPQYILYEDKTFRLNPDFYYTAGNMEFEKLFSKAKLPSVTKEEKIAYSIKAIEMYKGDFMPGYYDSWCEELRVKYKNMFITLSEDLVKLLEADGRYEEILKYSGKLINEDKLNDFTHISIINAHSKLGNTNMANNHFKLMLKLYHEELGEQPQPKTLEKINLILKIH